MGLTGGTLPEAAQDRALTEATAFAIRIDVAEELAVGGLVLVGVAVPVGTVGTP